MCVRSIETLVTPSSTAFRCSHTLCACRGATYSKLWHNYITLHRVSLTLKKSSVFILILSHLALMDTQHGHCTTLYCGKAAFFPLTSVWPKCDIQPRSAVISRRPGEGEIVEKFKQHAHKNTHNVQHTHMHWHTRTEAERIMGSALNHGMPQVTASDCQRTHPVTHALDYSSAHTHR